MRSIRLSPRSPRRDSRLSPTALRRLSTSPTRARISPRGLLTCVGEALGKAFADFGDRHAHSRPFGDDALKRRRPGALEVAGDIVRRRPERRSQPLAGFGQALAQTGAGGVEVGGDAVVRGRDGVADPRPAGHDRLALIGHFGDQQPDPALIVGIGALEGRNLGLHPGLEFGGARKRPFNPIAHRRKLATKGLGEVRHVLASRRLGLGEAHGDLGDRARRLPELAQAPRERGEGEHAKDRRQRRKQEERGLRPQQEFDRARRSRGPHGDIGVKHADRRPQKRADQGEDEWRPARRTCVHRLQDRAQVSRSSFAGALVGIAGFASVSGAMGAGPGRSSVEGSAPTGLGLRTGVAVVVLAGTSWGRRRSRP